jgi:SPP1 gp7 family putative phage head morphogenesis protein
VDLDSILDNGDEIASLMRPLYILLLTQAADDAGQVLGMDDLFSLDNPLVQETLTDLATLVRNVADTTKDEIRALVGRQAAEGWSVDELAQAILDRGEIASKTRAILIARTETAHAYSKGSILAYEASGVVSGTEWLLGPSPCPECRPLGGKTVDLGKEFASGVLHPPLHPACTCAVSPVLKER